ncbi:MAG: ABC transporter permease, partial [Actinomycetota bacterium]|nr:ABC transporter permease [Actinomycetota bacterium]
MEAVRVALQAVRAHRLRSVLTVLGVAIGVLAVVLLVAIGQGTRVEVTHTIEGLGSNLLLVFPGRADFGTAPTRSKFTLRDVERVGRALGDPSRVAADIVSGELVRARSRTSYASVLGVTETFRNVIARELSRGDYFSASDVASGRRLAILGADVAAGLLPGRDPLGESVTIAGLRF